VKIDPADLPHILGAVIDEVAVLLAALVSLMTNIS